MSCACACVGAPCEDWLDDCPWSRAKAGCPYMRRLGPAARPFPRLAGTAPPAPHPQPLELVEGEPCAPPLRAARVVVHDRAKVIVIAEDVIAVQKTGRSGSFACFSRRARRRSARTASLSFDVRHFQRQMIMTPEGRRLDDASFPPRPSPTRLPDYPTYSFRFEINL